MDLVGQHRDHGSLLSQVTPFGSWSGRGSQRGEGPGELHECVHECVHEYAHELHEYKLSLTWGGMSCMSTNRHDPPVGDYH